MDENKELQSTETNMKELAFQLVLDSMPSRNDADEHKGSDNVGLKVAGIVPTPDEERLELMQKVVHWPLEKAQEMLQRSNARRPAYMQQETPGRPSWGDFYAAEGRQEKEAILRGIFNGSLTSEEIELFFPKDGKNKR